MCFAATAHEIDLARLNYMVLLVRVGARMPLLALLVSAILTVLILWPFVVSTKVILYLTLLWRHVWIAWSTYLDTYKYLLFGVVNLASSFTFQDLLRLLPSLPVSLVMSLFALIKFIASNSSRALHRPAVRAPLDRELSANKQPATSTAQRCRLFPGRSCASQECRE